MGGISRTHRFALKTGVSVRGAKEEEGSKRPGCCCGGRTPPTSLKTSFLKGNPGDVSSFPSLDTHAAFLASFLFSHFNLLVCFPPSPFFGIFGIFGHFVDEPPHHSSISFLHFSFFFPLLAPCYLNFLFLYLNFLSLMF